MNKIRTIDLFAGIGGIRLGFEKAFGKDNIETVFVSEWDENAKATYSANFKDNFAIAGDITYAIGYRTMTDILEFIKSVDKVVKGFANPENLLYAPEIKFYSNTLVLDKNFQTNIENLYSIGDGGGLTTGLMMASASGVQMARNLLK